MLLYYQKTPLEQGVEALYQRLNITSTEQLNIAYIAPQLNIWVYHLDMNSMAVEKNGLFSMNIDSRLSAKEQWEDFLHELCHILRHAGNQSVMPVDFIDSQEQEAAHFQMYAAIPFFMLQRLSWPERQSECVDLIAEEFGVTHKLAAARLMQIQRRSLQGILDTEYEAYTRSLVRTYNPANWSEATAKIMNQLERQLARKGESIHGQTDRFS